MQTYTINTLKRFIAKKGKDYVIKYLSNPGLPEYIKKDLEKIGVFNDVLDEEQIGYLSSPSSSLF